MYLHTLTMKNFRQHRETSITFREGITGIVGRNGAGKSTLLEAIAWALYGQRAVMRMERGKADYIKSRGAGASQVPEVTLEFALSGESYKVVRRPNDAAMFVGGAKVHTGTGNVTAEVTRLLGMDTQAFFTSFFTGQKDLAFLKDVNTADREKYIGRLLGYERLTQARDLANQDKRTLNNTITGLKAGMPDADELTRRKKETAKALKDSEAAVTSAEQKHAESTKALEIMTSQRQQWDDKQQQYVRFKGEVDSLKQQVSFLTQACQQAKQRLEDAKAAHAQIVQLRPSLEDYEQARLERENLQQAKADFVRAHSLNSNLEVLQQNQKTLQKEYDQAVKLAEQFPSLKERHQLLKAELDSLNQKHKSVSDEKTAARASAAAEVKSLKERLTKLASQINHIHNAGPDGVCPTCERPLLEEYKKVTSQLDTEQSTIQKRIDELENLVQKLDTPDKVADAIKAQMDKLSAELESTVIEGQAAKAARDQTSPALNQRLEENQTQIQQIETELASLIVTFSQDQLNAVESKIASLEPVAVKVRKLQPQADALPEAEKNSDDYQAQLQDARQRLEASEKLLGELEYSEAAHAAFRTQIAEAEAAVNTSYRELTAAKGDLKTCQEMLAFVEKQISDLSARQQQLEDLRKQHLHAEFVEGAFTSLRAALNAQIKPRLIETACELLTEITDSRYCELDLDEQYNPRLFDDGEYKPVISGGEEDVLHLCLRLAISQMITERAGMPHCLLVLDEVFASLDETRRENVITLLQQLKNRFTQILVITHIESIYDMVDQCLWVDYDTASQSSQVREAKDGNPLSVLHDVEPETIGVLPF